MPPELPNRYDSVPEMAAEVETVGPASRSGLPLTCEKDVLDKFDAMSRA